MSEIRKGHLADLTTITRVYPEDKRLTVNCPVKALGGSVAVGDEVELYESVDGMGRIRDDSGRVRGRVKRLVAEVEIDLGTFKAPVPQGQESL